MEGHILGKEELRSFEQYLKREEYSTATVEKYLRELNRFEI